MRRGEIDHRGSADQDFLGVTTSQRAFPPEGRWSMTATDRPALPTIVLATCAAVPAPMLIVKSALEGRGSLEAIFVNSVFARYGAKKLPGSHQRERARGPRR
jgi:hypothetical protein